jgi:hypothetical protein
MHEVQTRGEYEKREKTSLFVPLTIADKDDKFMTSETRRQAMSINFTTAKYAVETADVNEMWDKEV